MANDKDVEEPIITGQHCSLYSSFDSTSESLCLLADPGLGDVHPEAKPHSPPAKITVH